MPHLAGGCSCRHQTGHRDVSLIKLLPGTDTLVNYPRPPTSDLVYVCSSCCHNLWSSSSRMRVIYHNWSATKQRPHPQSIAEISRHSVLSGDRIRQCETSSGSRHKDTDQLTRRQALDTASSRCVKNRKN